MIATKKERAKGMLSFITAAEKLILKVLEIIRDKMKTKAWLCAAAGLPLTFQVFAKAGKCCCVCPGQLQMKLKLKVEV